MPNNIFVIYVGLLLISGILAASFGYFALARTEMRSRRWFAALMGSLVVWSLTAAGELVFSGQTSQLLMKYLFLINGTTVPVVWVLFTAEYTYREIRTNPVVRLVGVVYVPLFVALVTNPVYGLYAPLTLRQTPFTHVEVGFGPGRVAAAIFVLGSMALGTYYLGRLFGRGRSQVSRPVAILAGAVLLGVVPFLGSVFGFFPVDTYDHTSLGVSVFLLGVSYVVFRYRFYDLSPIARDIILEEANDAMFVLDSDSRLVDHNSAAERIVPDLLESGTGRSFSELHADLATVVEELERDQEREITLPVGGERRHFSVQISIITVNSEAIGTVVFLRDITERRTRENQLERQNERLDRFASIVSHDLRNPLTVAQLNAELVSDGDGDADAVLDALDRMETMIEDMLTLARAGEDIESTESCRLAELVQDAWTNVLTEKSEFDVRIENATVQADDTRLTQLFENLFRNALDHNETPVTVRVGTLDTVDGFYVADTGRGIPEDDREEVFTHGYTTSDGGNGLGLAIVGDIVEAHGWTISVTESDEGGARFEVHTAPQVP